MLLSHPTSGGLCTGQLCLAGRRCLQNGPGARARHQPPAFRFEKAALVLRRRRQGRYSVSRDGASAAQRERPHNSARCFLLCTQAIHAFRTLQPALARVHAIPLPASASYPIHKQHALAATRMPIRASRWPPLPYRGPLAHPRLALCPLRRSRQIREAGSMAPLLLRAPRARTRQHRHGQPLR